MERIEKSLIDSWPIEIGKELFNSFDIYIYFLYLWNHVAKYKICDIFKSLDTFERKKMKRDVQIFRSSECNII